MMKEKICGRKKYEGGNCLKVCLNTNKPNIELHFEAGSLNSGNDYLNDFEARKKLRGLIETKHLQYFVNCLSFWL